MASLLGSPDRARFASDSAYRLRYAAYSAWWLLGLGGGLLVLLALRPWSNIPPVQFVLFLLYIGLGLGTGTAFLATAGFFVGGLWSRYLEADAAARRSWVRSKRLAYAWLALVVLVAAYGFVGHGLVFGETVFPSRSGLVVSYRSDRFWFLVSMACWVPACISGPKYVLRVFREARAT